MSRIIVGMLVPGASLSDAHAILCQQDGSMFSHSSAAFALVPRLWHIMVSRSHVALVRSIVRERMHLVMSSHADIRTRKALLLPGCHNL